MNPSELVDTLGRERAVAILRCPRQDSALAAMDAAVRGGFRVVELTFAVPGVLELIAAFARRPGLVVGAGTVLTQEQARAAVRAGARFLVSPILDEEMIAEARSLGVAILPGVHTPTEMWRAVKAGAPLLKLFPAPAGGPAYLRAVRGPFPDLKIVPTNGVTADNARAWLEAGAHALGFAGALFAPDLVAERRVAEIEALARGLLAACRSAP